MTVSGETIQYGSGSQSTTYAWLEVFQPVWLVYLELDSSHGTFGGENVSLSDWSVSFSEVWLQKDLENIAFDTFDRVVDWENMDSKKEGFTGEEKATISHSSSLRFR